ncbi:putative tetraspanin/Peripherin [Medicago truncatula]|uniref:Putative tetraspanin/Peripherin n=1 Tax=Medicago truncatula TaxID=3880 RepID=G7JRH3_MEDTR|nr:tetraspanin-3 [Medicago truncatula]AES88695.1 tetraspanin family protein [Medicago truncatula]RHN60823.1 putative tetraspanin/Peripherin [Medicago truncatula]
MRTSNHLIGVLNFLTFLLSIPILGGGIWLSSRANNTDCLKFLQWPLIIIGVSIMVVSLAGFAGACYRNTFLLRFYLVVMFFVIGVLIGFIIFAYVVTDKGSGRRVMNRGYLDYYLEDYSGWLEERVASDEYWGKISSCIRDSKACRKLARNFNDVPETADMFFERKLNPIQSGCCKPPTDCGYLYQNETVWIQGAGLVGTNPDCNKWNNDQQQLCYDCDSCKAGVLGSLKKSWRKVSVINIVVMIILVIVYIVAYYAYRNNKKMDNDEPYGEARMTKSQPSAFHL